MYRIFFQSMKHLFVEIVLYVLYLPHTKTSDPLSREDICAGVALIVELVSTFAIVCPQYFRKMVLEGPVPATNPMTSAAGSQQGAKKSSPEESKWKSKCLLFLLIDVIVTNRCDTSAHLPLLFIHIVYISSLTLSIHKSR